MKIHVLKQNLASYIFENKVKSCISAHKRAIVVSVKQASVRQSEEASESGVLPPRRTPAGGGVDALGPPQVVEAKIRRPRTTDAGRHSFIFSVVTVCGFVRLM